MKTIRGTGWREREAAAKAKLALRDAGYNLALTEKEVARSSMIAAKEAQDRAYAEEVARQRTVMMIDCPCCAGAGIVLLNEAAKMVEAIRRYDFVGWKPDADTLAKLLPMAVAVDGSGKRITGTETAEARSDDEAVAQIDHVEPVKKPVRRHFLPPHLDQ